MTDAEYRALSERLAALYWVDKIGNADCLTASSAIPALLEERDGWRKIAERLAWLEPSLNLAESRLGKAVAVLRICLNRIERPELSPDANWVVERARSVLSDLEKSE